MSDEPQLALAPQVVVTLSLEEAHALWAWLALNPQVILPPVARELLRVLEVALADR